jgi:hypothetical protein
MPVAVAARRAGRSERRRSPRNRTMQGAVDLPAIDRGIGDRAARDRRLADAEGLTGYFGCGTIRMYGLGDFQPCG